MNLSHQKNAMLPMLMLMKAELLKQANFKQIILYTDDDTDLLVGDTNDLFAEIRPVNNLGLTVFHTQPQMICWVAWQKHLKPEAASVLMSTTN